MRLKKWQRVQREAFLFNINKAIKSNVTDEEHKTKICMKMTNNFHLIGRRVCVTKINIILEYCKFRAIQCQCA